MLNFNQWLKFYATESWCQLSSWQKNKYTLLNGNAQDDGPEIVHHADVENPTAHEEDEEEEVIDRWGKASDWLC